MAYQVREYIRPLLRCYNCQRFGHAAGSCWGKRKCAKCGEDHVIQNCEAEALKCPNFGGDHAAVFCGCMHSVEARRVQPVRENDKVSYAEAVQSVARERTDSTAREGAVMGSQRNVPKPLPALPSDMLILNKESFLAFVSDMLVRVQKAANRSDIIRLLVGAAERFLGTKQLPEKLHQHMIEIHGMDMSQLTRTNSLEDVSDDNEVP